jgi:ankyrin repeat protein
MKKGPSTPTSSSSWTLLTRGILLLCLCFALYVASEALSTPFEYRGERGPSKPRLARRPAPLELYVAARAGDIELTRALLSRGARVDAATSTGEQALHAAAAAGHTGVVIELLKQSSIVPSAATVHGVTALLLAATAGHAEVVTVLLAAGADVGARTTYDKATPFMRAARARHEDIARALLVAGAAPDARDVDGRTALTYAAEEGAAAVVALCLAAKADVDAFQLSNGMTPLMFAANAGNTELVAALLRAGAGVNLTSTWDKMSALHRAAAGGHLAVAQLLIDAHSNVDGVSMGSGQDGLTPLMLAARAGSPDVVALLIAHGANVKAKDGWKADRKSVLEFAQESGRSEVIDALTKAGAM